MRVPFRRAGRHHTVVAAYLALFCALGGTAYAAVSVTSEDIVDETIQSRDIGADAVDNAEIRDDAVTQNKLRYDSVTSAKIANGQVNGTDVANGSLTGYDIADHSVGNAELALSRVSSVSGSNWAHDKTQAVACPAGKTAVGGGGQVLGVDSQAPAHKATITESYPDGAGWVVKAALIVYPSVPEWTFSYDGDYVTGYNTWSKVDTFTYTGPWVLKAWAVCV
jgi:hypothetical protein